MKIRLLPSSFESDGSASAKQHLTCLIVNDRVAIDAGSLAMGVSDLERSLVRDVVLTHSHLDHIAGLPLFVDDLFASLTEPLRVHASKDVIEVLERDVFNWSVYPRFSELSNGSGPVIRYIPFTDGAGFRVGDLAVKPLSVNHKVPSSGFIVADGRAIIAITGDTSAMETFWDELEGEGPLSALLIECAFPDELSELAAMSHHLTPLSLKRELDRPSLSECPIYIVNIKPAYREQVISQLRDLDLPNLEILEIGRAYEF